MEVRPRRAREAFCRCEQVCARRTRDMVFLGCGCGWGCGLVVRGGWLVGSGAAGDDGGPGER